MSDQHPPAVQCLISNNREISWYIEASLAHGTAIVPITLASALELYMGELGSLASALSLMGQRVGEAYAEMDIPIAVLPHWARRD